MLEAAALKQSTIPTPQAYMCIVSHAESTVVIDGGDTIDPQATCAHTDDPYIDSTHVWVEMTGKPWNRVATRTAAGNTDGGATGRRCAQRTRGGRWGSAVDVSQHVLARAAT